MQKTGIEYLTHTWNPLAMRCTRVSAGCQECWHLRMADRLSKNPALTEPERQAFAGGDIVIREGELNAPLKLRKPATIGVQFMGDLFHKQVPDYFIVNALEIMCICDQHSFVVLTKRPERMAEITQIMKHIWAEENKEFPQHIYFGTTVENQEQADKRIPDLLKVPGKRFLSIEPLLSSLDLLKYLKSDNGGVYDKSRNGFSCSTCDRNLFCGQRRPNMAASEDDGGQSHGDTGLRDADKDKTGGKKQKQIPNCNVYSKREEDENLCSPDCLDGNPSVRHSIGNRDKPQGWQQRKQPPIESRNSNPCGKYDAQLQGIATEEEISVGRDKHVCQINCGTGNRNPEDERHYPPIETRPEIRSQPGHRFCNSYRRKLESPQNNPLINALIVGAESGPHRRECRIEWIEDIVEQCKSAGVPVFVKQIHLNGKLEKDINKFPEQLRIRELPWLRKEGTQ